MIFKGDKEVGFGKKIGKRGTRIETLDFEAEAPKAVEADTSTSGAKVVPDAPAKKARTRRNGGAGRLVAGE